MAVVVNFFEGPDDLPRRMKWTNDLAAALDQGLEAAYVNFLRDEGEARLRQAYPGPTYERLATVKRRYDPREPVPPEPEHSARALAFRRWTSPARSRSTTSLTSISGWPKTAGQRVK